MSWPHMVGFALAGLGAVGFCLMIAAFVMTAIQGGWNKSIQQPIAEGRWPMPRRLMLVGASLGMLMFIGVAVLRLIMGPFPWGEPSSGGQSSSDQAHRAPPNDVISQPTPVKSQPRPPESGRPTE